MSALGTTPETTAELPEATRTWMSWLAAAGAVVAVFLVLSLLSEGFAAAPSGPADSSLATTPGGVAAWAELLARAGHPVGALRAPLGSAKLYPASTLVVLGASGLTTAEARNLNRFVSAGGRLVIGGGDPTAALAKVMSSAPKWTDSGPQIVRAGAGSRLAGVSEVRTAGEGAWTSVAGTDVLLGGASGALLVTKPSGRGSFELLADSSPLQNRLLATADNAQLGIDLAGQPGRPVVFAEALHGYGEASGLAAIPTRWWLALAGLGVAGLLWAISRGRRLGPAERLPADPAPPRGAYIESLATTLTRSRPRQQLAELARAAGIEPPASGANKLPEP